MPKTWTQKYENGQDPKVVVLDKEYAGFAPGSKMLISSPEEIDALVRSIPRGASRTTGEIREELAAKHGVETTCPLTTGIFLRIVSERAWEQLKAGNAIDTVTPFWRAVDPKSRLGKKLSCGPTVLADMRSRESNPS